MRVALLAFAVAAAAPTGPAARAADPALTLGLVSGMFRDRQPAVIQVLARPFCDLVAKQVGAESRVELEDDAAALTDRLRDGKVQLGVYHGFEFAWAQQQCDDLVPLLVARPAGGGATAALVVPADGPAKAVADLADAAVLVPRGAKAHTLVFLDKLRDGLDAHAARPAAKADQTPEDVLTAVAAGTAAAALVDGCALEGYKVLHPGGGKALRVLAASEEFPPAVVCYRKGGLTDDQVKQVRDGLTACAKTPSGKVLMSLWNLEGFEAPPKGHQAALDAILKAYPPPKAGGTPGGGGKGTPKSPGGK